MKIDLICNDGSPIGVTPELINGRGVGGAELAMMNLMRKFAEAGHDVRVFNDPQGIGVYDGVKYFPLPKFSSEEQRDVLIIFRSPNSRVHFTRMNREETKIFWWSTDQRTVGDFRQLAQQVDFVVTISPYHTEYHKRIYGIDSNKIHHIDIGVEVRDYDQDVERIKNQLLFCSIPDRGLRVLHAAWPQIKRDVDDATLVITSDYTLWGSRDPNNQQHKLMWAGAQDVRFVGKVPRPELIKLQLQSDLQSYPCTYEELFCISSAECQVAGALPVTTEVGALTTTNQWGIRMPGNPYDPMWVKGFANRIVNLLVNERDYLESQRAAMMQEARKRFSMDNVLEQWERLFKEGKL